MVQGSRFMVKGQMTVHDWLRVKCSRLRVFMTKRNISDYKREEII